MKYMDLSLHVLRLPILLHDNLILMQALVELFCNVQNKAAADHSNLLICVFN